MSSLAPLTGGSALAPLQRDEIELLNRLLADPTLFPREFKRWVTDHASDTVDIAKSQVHGLVDKGGDVYIPAPPNIAQLPGGYKEIVIGLTVSPGGTGTIVSLPAVECDGNEVILEMMVPLIEYMQAIFNLNMDGNFQGQVARFKHHLGSSNLAMAPLYIQRNFKPAKGTHSFSIDGRSVGSNSLFVMAGVQYPSVDDYLSPGFFRISRA